MYNRERRGNIKKIYYISEKFREVKRGDREGVRCNVLGERGVRSLFMKRGEREICIFICCWGG
jgi:hypothetical protein